jgi:hypothetical protein
MEGNFEGFRKTWQTSDAWYHPEEVGVNRECEANKNIFCLAVTGLALYPPPLSLPRRLNQYYGSPQNFIFNKPEEFHA